MMLDLGLGTPVGDFETLSNYDYKKLMLEEAEKEMMDEHIVEI